MSRGNEGLSERDIRSIAFVMPVLGYGGIETVFLTIATALVSEGWSCQVLPEVIAGDKALELVPSNIRLIQSTLHASDLKHQHLLRQVLSLRRQLDLAKAEVVVSGYQRTNIVTGFALALRAPRHRPKWIMTVHEDPESYISGKKTAGMVKQLLLRVSCLRADDAVAVSPTMAKKATAVYRRGFGVIPNAIPPLASDNYASLNLLPFVDDGHPVAVFVGRLDKHKRVDDLMRAVASLGQNSGIRLLVIGDGEDKERLTHVADELGLNGSTFFTGFLPHPWSSLRRLQNAVLVLPSMSEGFAMVLVEAMSSGMPVVSSSFEGVRDLLINDYNGIVVPIGDVKALSQAIALVTTDRELARELVNNALVSVRRFDLAVVLPVWLEHLGRLAPVY